MKKEKSNKAQGQIITTVLIILIVIIAVIIVWNVVRPLIKESSEQVEGGVFTTQLDIEEANMYVSGGGEVRIKRGPGKGEITALKFLFYDEEGSSVIVEEDGTKGYCDLPNELETKICSFNASDINVEKVSVVPSFGNNLGMETSKNNPETDLAIDDLISWWKFDGNFKDSVGNHDGDNLRTGADASTNVLVVDGVDDYVNIGTDIDDFKFGMNSFSISGWAKKQGAYSNTPALFGVRVGTTTSRYSLTLNSEGQLHFFAKDNNDNSIDLGVGSNILNDNQWHHAVMVVDRDNDIGKMYADGQQIGSNIDISSLTGDISPEPALAVIARQVHSYGFFNGSIDDVVVWGKALNEDEVTAIYNNQKGGKI